MKFDPNNRVVVLCAKGMELEGTAPIMAANKFHEAWNLAKNDLEKAIAAHYVARHQKSIQEKLDWDETALGYALKVKHLSDAFLPSLFLNIGKGYEDLNRTQDALEAYDMAKEHLKALPEDGYTQFVAMGVEKGLKRIKEAQTPPSLF